MYLSKVDKKCIYKVNITKSHNQKQQKGYLPGNDVRIAGQTKTDPSGKALLAGIPGSQHANKKQAKKTQLDTSPICRLHTHQNKVQGSGLDLRHYPGEADLKHSSPQPQAHKPRVDRRSARLVQPFEKNLDLTIIGLNITLKV